MSKKRIPLNNITEDLIKNGSWKDSEIKPFPKQEICWFCHKPGTDNFYYDEARKVSVPCLSCSSRPL